MSADQENNAGKSGMMRRALLHGAASTPLLAATSAPLLAAAMGARAAMAQGTSESAGGSGPFPSHPRWRFVFVNHVTTNPFFIPTQYGIQDACALLGCHSQWTGSATSDAAEMVNAMNAAIAAQAAAIGVCIVDPKAFEAPVQRALDAGIPVFAYNADAPASSGNGRLAYIGQDLYKSGAQMGQRIVDLVESGTIGLFIATPGQLNIQPRLDGASDVIKKSGKQITIQTVATGPTVNQEMNAIKAFYRGHQDLKGMFAVDGGSTQAVAETMKQYNLPSKGVHGGGFDLLPRTLNLMKDGFLDFTIDQQPYLQGFYTVMEMFMFIASGGLTGAADINTGVKFVTRDTVGPYLATKTRYEGNATAAEIIPRSGPIKA